MSDFDKARRAIQHLRENGMEPDCLTVPNITPEQIKELQQNPLVLEIWIKSENGLIRIADFTASNEVEKQAMRENREIT